MTHTPVYADKIKIIRYLRLVPFSLRPLGIYLYTLYTKETAFLSMVIKRLDSLIHMYTTPIAFAR